MRILGLDLGSKTIGVALSDELGYSAQPLTVLARRGGSRDLTAVADLVQEYGAEQIVLGLPLNMNGSPSPASEKVQAFGQRLAEFVAAGGLAVEVVYWDERWSTLTAERVLIQADLSRARRKKVIDKLAASVILQGYLDRLAVQEKED